MDAAHRTHTHSHRCRRHGGHAAALQQQVHILQLEQQLATLRAQQAAANAPPPTSVGGKIMHAIRPITSVILPSLLGGLMMGAGTLLARYLWGRFVAHDILAGEFVPHAQGQKMVVDSVDAQGHPEKVLVEAHHIDTTSEAVGGAITGAVSAGLAPTFSTATAEMAAQPMQTTAPAASVASAAAPAAAGGASKGTSAGSGRA